MFWYVWTKKNLVTLVGTGGNLSVYGMFFNMLDSFQSFVVD
jgi:hypothetical protein